MIVQPPMIRRLAAVLALSAAVLVAAPRPARAQMDSREGIALQNQILELRHDMQVLRDQMARGGGGGGGSSLGGGYRPPPPSGGGGGGDMTAQLLDRVTQLEDEVRRLRGRIDEVDNARQSQANDLNKQIGDLNFKLSNGAGGLGAAAAGRPAAPSLSPPVGTLGGAPSAAVPPPPAPSGPPPRTPELVLQEGNAALARRDYATAEAAAHELLNGPRTPRSTDAQFLLAQAVAGRRDYAQAAVAYDDAYNRSKTGIHAQDSLLGLANSLNAIGEKRAACATLDKMRTEFPRPRPELVPQIAGARSRAGCT